MNLIRMDEGPAVASTSSRTVWSASCGGVGGLVFVHTTKAARQYAQFPTESFRLSLNAVVGPREPMKILVILLILVLVVIVAAVVRRGMRSFRRSSRDGASPQFPPGHSDPICYGNDDGASHHHSHHDSSHNDGGDGGGDGGGSDGGGGGD